MENIGSKNLLPRIQKNNEGSSEYVFGNDVYKLIELSDEYVGGLGFEDDVTKNGLLKIELNGKDKQNSYVGKIWHYDIPEEFLPYALLNEIFCPDVLSGESGKCRVGLEEEISYIPQSIKKGYLPWRRDFFHSMVSMYSGKHYEKMQITKEENDKYRTEMEKCVDFLDHYFDELHMNIDNSCNQVRGIL